MAKYCLQLFIILVFTQSLRAQHIELLQQGKKTSIRGLSVVDDKTAWISGSKGTIAITNDGGKTWNWSQVKGFEQADFRDIEAFSSTVAIIMSSGTPALILKTTDGGNSWQVKYRNNDSTCFFDAMDFAGKKHGLILGDPIHNQFLMMETNDGGQTWHPFKNPPPSLPGEAAFAASGTCLRMDKNTISIVSGGTAARIFSMSSPEAAWHIGYLPLKQGKPSQGAFSVANNSVYVGGDYAHDKVADSVACWFNVAQAGIKGGIVASDKNPAGFQSCVEYIKGNTYLSTGTPGSNITTDSGRTWAKIDDTSYNVCRKAKHGKLLLLAGNGGKIGILVP